MGLDATFKRLSPLVICFMIAVIAYFQARGIGQLIATSIAAGPPPPHLGATSRSALAAADPDHARSADLILARNPFDSVTGPIDPSGAKDGGAAAAPVEDDKDPYADPPCAGARALLIAGSSDPAWSFAAVVGADGKTRLIRRGEQLDGHQVHFIGDLRSAEGDGEHDGERGMWERVWLTANGSRCQLALGARVTNERPRPAAPQSAAPASPLGDKLRKTGENQFEIDRSAVEALISNPAELMKARIFPVREGDRVVGMKLLNIKPGSLLGSLGMQSGDQLTSINGYEMNDPQRMLEAYSKLMKADRLTATLIRQGRPVNIDLSIK